MNKYLMDVMALLCRLDGLTDELQSLKKQVDDLRTENDWLQQEAQKVRTESVRREHRRSFRIDD